MKVLWCLVACAVVALVADGAASAQAQEGLEQAAERARAAWLRHDVDDLLASSDTVRLQLPGVTRSAALEPGQAARLLARYLGSAREVEFDLVGLRRAAQDHGYAEGVRRFVIEGTSDERRETVFIGLRQVDGVWRVREVRVVR
ncbi:MAG TPA: hypothetical protein VNL18_00800 [Gemmatimonadales bacterium]|nr:hypothetical protein [Gemmatimonadales bacterium]